MALAKIGCVASLLNYSQRKTSLVHSINLSHPKLIIVGSELMEHFSEITGDIPNLLDKVRVAQHPTAPAKTSFADFDSNAKSFSTDEPKINYDIYAGDPCMYVFTSGTTGLPKAAIVNHLRWIKGYSGFGLALLQMEPEDILYVPLPFYHSTAMIVCWTSVVAGGSGMVLKRKFSVSEFWPDIHNIKPQVLAMLENYVNTFLMLRYIPSKKTIHSKEWLVTGLDLPYGWSLRNVSE